MQSEKIYYVIFLLSGLLLLSVGIIFVGLLKNQVISYIFLSLGTTIIAVILVNFLWEKSGGEPVLKSLEILEKSSKIINDSTNTGVYRIFHNRRTIRYDIINEEISTAKEVFIVSLIFRVAQSPHLEESILKCIKNDGIVRILISSPEITKDGKSQKPLPLEVRQYAEKDLVRDRMLAEIEDTVEYLKDVKEKIQNCTPNNAKNFQYKLLSTHTMYCSIMGIDQRIYLTNYLNKYQGLSSPTMIIEKTDSKQSLYKIYKEEFDYLWKKADG